MKGFLFAAVLLGATACASPPQQREVRMIHDARLPTPGVVAGGRLGAADVAALRNAGIRQVIDLSLDGETPGFDEAGAVQAEGIGYSNLPVRGAEDLTLAKVTAFARLLQASPRPVLVHCASGNRVGAMAALRAAWLEDKALEEAIAIGRAWGLAGLENAVRTRIEAGPGEADTR